MTGYQTDNRIEANMVYRGYVVLTIVGFVSGAQEENTLTDL